MIIHRLKLERFKKFHNYEIHLQPGLNIIKGPNESGKSTLLEALISSFFYDTTSKIDGYRSWNSQERPNLELELSVTEQRLILKKHFETSSSSLGYCDGSKEETSSKKIKRLLTEYLGFDTDKTFLATSCIRQHELDIVAKDTTPSRLENILLGGSGSVDVSAIIKQLDNAITELKPRPKSKNPGPLVNIPAEIQKLEGPLKRAATLENDRTKLNKELTQLKEKHKPKNILWERTQRYREWKSENEQLKQEFDDIHLKTTEYEKLARYEKEITQNRHFKTEEGADKLKWRVDEYSHRPKWCWWILTLGAIYIIYKVKVKRILKQANCVAIDEFYRVYTEYKELHKNRNKLQARLEHASLEQLEKKKLDISRQLAVNEAQRTSDMEMAGLKPEELIILEQEIKELTGRIQELTNLYKETEIRIREITLGKGELVEIEEKLDHLREEFTRANHRLQVLSLTKDTMEKARRSVLLSRIEDFNKHISSYLSLFTQNRYTEIKTDINETGIQFLIYSPEKDEWVKPEELSSGTQDQLYLAARITLLKLVAGDRRPPLVMDDPFTSFDRDRLNSAMQVCTEISKEYQVILFTCTNRYDNYADNILILPSPGQKEFQSTPLPHGEREG